MPIPAHRISTFGTTVFSEINMLAQQYNALNLGQGKPDFDDTHCPWKLGTEKPFGHGYVRFAFCKSDETLQEADERLSKLT